MPEPPRAAACALALLTLLASSAAPAAGAAADPEPGCDVLLTGEELPSPEQLEASGARIREIRIDPHDIFDPRVPGEDFWAFRLANRLHSTTRERVVRQRLVFAPGEPFVARRLAESERLLRRERFLYDAVVRPVAYCDGLVDVEVVTRDVWSLKPGASFSRRGGENAWEVEVQDSNFLGLGTDLTLSRDQTVDRSSTLVRFRDSDFLARRLRFELWASDTSDGELSRFELERPFRSLESRHAVGVRAFRQRRLDSRYELGDVTDRFEVRQELVELSFGRSPGLREGRVSRLRFGATWDANRFAEEPGAVRERPLPADRRLAYPWVAREWIEERFVEGRNLDRIDRTEDVDLGRRGNLWLGLASEALGADRDAVLFGGSVADGFAPAPGQLLLAAAAASGRLERSGRSDDLRNGLYNGLASLSLRYYRRNFGRQLFFATLAVDASHRLDPERQLLLGGDSGLRGYPLRYQDGNRRLLLTLEQRFYHSRELFHLVRVGGAVFFDAGKAWSAGEAGRESLGILRDVGVGLRLGSSRSANAAMIHLDVAFALDARRGERGVQWLVTTSDTF